MVNVRKADGTVQPFDPEKVLRTCHNLRLSKSESMEILSEIERKLSEGMSTRKIIDMIFEHGRSRREHIGHMIDIRQALAMMRPKPDFEKFVAAILEHEGYKTATNKIVYGKCVDHEIDVIAWKNGETLYVEVKHHFDFHTFTGLGVFLEVNSVFEDLVQGYLNHRHQYGFTKPMVVLNTKISEHARRYAACRGIGALGWEIPENAGIERYINDKMIYPITVLRGLDSMTQARLGDAGVYTLKQLAESDQSDLSRSFGIERSRIAELVEKTNSILRS